MRFVFLIFLFSAILLAGLVQNDSVESVWTTAQLSSTPSNPSDPVGKLMSLAAAPVISELLRPNESEKRSMGGKFIAYYQACEKELGPIPSEKNIQKKAEVQSPPKIHGREVFKEAMAKKGKESVVFKYKDSGKPVEPQYVESKEGYSPQLKVCDNPTHAGYGEDFCAGKATIYRLKSENPDVIWVQLERQGQPIRPIIGWNRKTGATCFLEAGSDQMKGLNPLNPKDQETAYGFQNRGEADNCLRCHTGSDPYLITPFIKDAFEQLEIDRHRKDFSEGEYHYHIPGMAYSNLNHLKDKIHVHNGDGTENHTCTQCHQVMGSPLLASAVGAHDPFKDQYFGVGPGSTPRILALQAWMPEGASGSQEEQKAVRSLKQYVEGKPTELPVTSEKVSIEYPTKKPSAPGHVLGMSAKVADGKVTLNWKTDPSFADKEDDTRFKVKATFLLKANGKEKAFDYTWPGFWGVSDGNKGFPRDNWTFSHAFPELENGAELISIKYSVMPVKFVPDDNRGNGRYGGEWKSYTLNNANTSLHNADTPDPTVHSDR